MDLKFTEPLETDGETTEQNSPVKSRLKYIVVPTAAIAAAACAVILLCGPWHGGLLKHSLSPDKSGGAAVTSSSASSAASKAASSTASKAASSAPAQQISLETAAAQVSLAKASRPLSIDVSLSAQRVTVYDAKERIVKQFVCSTGSEGNETPTGTFRVQDRGKSFYSDSVKEGGYYWTQFSGNFLFHSVPFDKDRQMEPEEAAKIGTPASHGCVRLPVEDAKWIYDNIPRGTIVTIR